MVGIGMSADDYWERRESSEQEHGIRRHLRMSAADRGEVFDLRVSKGDEVKTLVEETKQKRNNHVQER